MKKAGLMVAACLFAPLHPIATVNLSGRVLLHRGTLLTSRVPPAASSGFNK